MYEILSKYGLGGGSIYPDIESKIKSMKSNQIRFSLDDTHMWIMPASRLWIIFESFCNVVDAMDRELILTKCRDCYNEVGTQVISLKGSPVRAWAVLDESSGVIVYNNYFKKTKIYNNTIIINDVWDDIND